MTEANQPQSENLPNPHVVLGVARAVQEIRDKLSVLVDSKVEDNHTGIPREQKHILATCATLHAWVKKFTSTVDGEVMERISKLADVSDKHEVDNTTAPFVWMVQVIDQVYSVVWTCFHQTGGDMHKVPEELNYFLNRMMADAFETFKGHLANAVEASDTVHEVSKTIQ